MTSQPRRSDADLAARGNDTGQKPSPLQHNPSSTSTPQHNPDSPTRSTGHTPHTRHTATDRGWAYIIVVAAFFLYALADGVILTFGVVFSELVRYFGSEPSRTALVGSLLTSLPMLAGPLASALINRYGCRLVTVCGGVLAALGFALSILCTSIEMLYLTMGVMAGLGLACVFVSSIVAVSFYFDKYRSMATGVATCGSGIGMFAFAPMIQAMIDEYGWKGATLVIAGFFLNICVFGALLRPFQSGNTRTAKGDNPVQTDSHQSSKNCSQLTDTQLLSTGELQPSASQSLTAPDTQSTTVHVRPRRGVKSICQNLESAARSQCGVMCDKSYLLFWVSNFLLYMWYDTPYIYLTEQVGRYGITQDQSALLLSIIGIANTAGLLTYGYLGDKSYANTLTLYAVSTMVCGAAVSAVPLLHTYAALCAFSATFGFTISANYALESIILVKLLGLESFTNAYGIIYFGQGVANLIGPPIAGLFYDIEGNYDLSFYISGVLVFLSGLMLLPICSRTGSAFTALPSDDTNKDPICSRKEHECSTTEFETVV